jgi:hypothetical protein
MEQRYIALWIIGFWVQSIGSAIAQDGLDGGCDIPEIISIFTNSPICGGDTLTLDAEVIENGDFVTYEWFGPQVIQSNSTSTTAPGGTGMNYILEVTNECGTASMTVWPTIHVATETSLPLCGPTGMVDLNSLTSFSSEYGTWFLNEEEHSSTYDPMIDTTGHYLHYNTLGCLVLSLDLYEWPAVNAGTDTAITVCSNSEPVPLFPLLGGQPDTGGYWSVSIGSMNGIYDPGVHNTDTYLYHVSNNGCSHIATVYVAEIQAIPWYTDQDGDGFGDPAEMVIECDQLEGTVGIAGDNCPILYGLVGYGCDDNMATTVNDTITADCECHGELITSLNELAEDPLLLWPSPISEDRFFIQTQRNTAVELYITDNTGRTIERLSLPGSIGPILIEMQEPLSSGMYLMTITSSDRVCTARFMVEH